MWLLSLWMFSTGAVISSILVITSVKAINAIICLIIAFINAIGIFMLLGVDFIALIYCIVYVGAIAILFLFVIMLLSENGELQDSEILPSGPLNLSSVIKNLFLQKTLKRSTNTALPKSAIFNNLNKKSTGSTRPMVILIGILYIVEVWCGIAASSISRISENRNLSYCISDVTGSSSSINSLSYIFNKNCITSLGEMLYSECGYEVLLIISLILLVGMIGSIVLTLRDN